MYKKKHWLVNTKEFFFYIINNFLKKKRKKIHKLLIITYKLLVEYKNIFNKILIKKEKIKKNINKEIIKLNEKKKIKNLKI